MWTVTGTAIFCSRGLVFAIPYGLFEDKIVGDSQATYYTVTNWNQASGPGVAAAWETGFFKALSSGFFSWIP